MADAKAIASYFINRSSSVEENDLTNLKLQKILFYAQAEHYKAHGVPLFPEEIEAWDYGPVVSSVYHWLKVCGAYPITAFDIDADSSSLTQQEEQFLEGVWQAYGKYSASFLVARTHETGSPWERVFSVRKNGTITLESLSDAKLANEWTN